MSLVEQILADQKEAMKNREQIRLSVLRMLSTSVKNKAIAKRDDLTDEEVQAVIRTEVKRRQEAATAWRQAKQEDKAVAEEKEAEILQAYLPAQLSDDELKSLIEQIIQENNLKGAAQFGQAMGKVMSVVAGRADGKRVQTFLRAALQ
ncbi:MAG: GatB/YqeY domain-containing protein [Candidatus Komeilibacteria bacterium]